MKPFATFTLLATLLAGCGGGDSSGSGGETPPEAQAPAPAPAATVTPPDGAMTVPDWYTVDNAAKTVHLAVTSGATPLNNYWNYNGFIKGQIAITVPAGYTVSIELTNNDPNMAHSVGISTEISNFINPPAPVPAFEGAITDNATSMIDGVMPGETETITFVADEAGTYSMVCFIPGHSAVGMWVFFKVSAEEEAGVQGL